MTRAPGPILVGACLSTMLQSSMVPPRRLRANWKPRSSFCEAVTTGGLQSAGGALIGLSGLSITDCGRLVAGQVRGAALTSPRDGFSPPLMLRFAVDDLKAYYLEAGAEGIAKPSSRQLGDWFWNATAAGAALHALRAVCLTSSDNRLKLIAGNFIVPAARVLAPG